MDRRDRIATLAALVLVAGIGAFAIAHNDHAGVGAYYYFSDSPDPSVNEEMREFATRNKILQDESASMAVGSPPRVERSQPAAEPIPKASTSAGRSGAP